MLLVMGVLEAERGQGPGTVQAQAHTTQDPSSARATTATNPGQSPCWLLGT